MLHVTSTQCVALDLHTILPWPLECTCWRQFVAQRGDCKNLDLRLSMPSLFLLLNTLGHKLADLPKHSGAQACWSPQTFWGTTLLISPPHLKGLEVDRVDICQTQPQRNYQQQWLPVTLTWGLTLTFWGVITAGVAGRGIVDEAWEHLATDFLSVPIDRGCSLFFGLPLVTQVTWPRHNDSIPVTWLFSFSISVTETACITLSFGRWGKSVFLSIDLCAVQYGSPYSWP